MLFQKKKISKNVYSEKLKSENKSKKESMSRLFESSNHATQASKTCATNRTIQSAVSKNSCN